MQLGGVASSGNTKLDPNKPRSTGTGSMINGAFRSRNTLHQRSSDQDRQITHEKLNAHGHTVREKQRAQSMPKDGGHKRSGENESMALSPDSISQPRNKGVYRVVTSHCDAQQQSCAKHSLDKDSHPSSKQGIVSPDNGSMVRDKEVKEVTRKGFGGTHRRNLHAGLSSKSHNSQGTRGDCDGSHSSNKGLGSKTSEKAPSSKPPSYVQGLTDLLSEKVKHLKPDKPKKANPKSESEIPLSREEAKRELKSRMKALKRDIDDTEEQKQKESQAGGKSGPGRIRARSNQEVQRKAKLKKVAVGRQSKSRLDRREIFIPWLVSRMRTVSKLKLSMGRFMDLNRNYTTRLLTITVIQPKSLKVYIRSFSSFGVLHNYGLW